jgi:hypothetical protein
MRTNAFRFAAGLMLIAFGAPFPASGQYLPPPLIIFPPPAQDYAAPRPVLKPPPPDKPKPSDTSGQTKPTGRYQGRTFVPD